MDYATVEKSPADDLPWEWDFTDEDVFVTDPIASGTATKWDGTAISGLVVFTPTVVTGGRKLQTRINSGVHLTDYEIKIQAVGTANGGQNKREMFAKMQVRRAV